MWRWRKRLELIGEGPEQAVYRLWYQTHGPSSIPGMTPPPSTFVPPILGVLALLLYLWLSKDTSLLFALLCSLPLLGLLFLLVSAFDMGGGFARLREEFTHWDWRPVVSQYVRLTLDRQAQTITLESEGQRRPYHKLLRVAEIERVEGNPEFQREHYRVRATCQLYFFLKPDATATADAGSAPRSEVFELASPKDATLLAAHIQRFFGLPSELPEPDKHPDAAG